MQAAPGLRHERGTFVGSDETDRYEQAWRPAKDPKAAVVLVHSYAEHSGRHRRLGEHLAQHGYAVYTFDLTGHGQSAGTRAYVASFDVHLDDLALFLGRVRAREADRPLFLLGHSMGGTIVTLFAVTRQPDLRGLVLSGPELKPGRDFPSLLVRLAPLGARLFPRLPTLRIDSRSLSRDPEVVARYDADLLVYRSGMPAQTGAEIKRALDRVQARMESLTLPFLILHGTADRLADPEGSKQLYHRAGAGDKTLELYEGFYHEVFNEPGKEQVLADLVAWLDERS